MIAYVARHGETVWNRDGRYQGRRESSLTQTGQRQAGALASELATVELERIMSSPLRRCAETASASAKRHGLGVEYDANLIEIGHGTWEGRLRDQIARDDPDTMRAWRERPETVQFDGGESLADVAARWQAFAERQRGGDFLVVTHDVVVRIAILHATRRPLSTFWEPRVVNCGYARFCVKNGAWELLDECRDEHLGGLQVDTRSQAL